MAKATKTKAPKNTLVTFLLDKSGSMSAVRDSTIEAFNAYLDGMKDQKNISFSLVQFDSGNGVQRVGENATLEKTCVAVPVAQAPRLSNDNYIPRGGTPLIESAIKVIDATAARATKDDQVVICIQTDGQENSSGAEYTWERLNALIAEKQKLGWQFNFMGAGINAYQQGAKMGLSAANTMSYNHTDLAATRAAFSGRSRSTVAYAAGTASNMAFSAMEKLAAGDVFDPTLKNTAKPVIVPQFSLAEGTKPAAPKDEKFAL